MYMKNNNKNNNVTNNKVLYCHLFKHEDFVLSKCTVFHLECFFIVYCAKITVLNNSKKIEIYL